MGCAIKSNDVCHKCQGKKVLAKSKQFEIRVPQGVPNGALQNLKEKGHFDLQRRKSGDVIIKFTYNVPPHISSIDERGNLFVKLGISLEQLLVGFKMKIDIYARPFLIISQMYFDPSNTITFKEKGLPNFNNNKKRGDLKVLFTIQYPKDLLKLQKYNDVFLKIFKKDLPEIQDSEKEAHDVLSITQ